MEEMKLPKCLSCESGLLPLIDFGMMPLVNTYGVQEKFPLSVNRCVSCCHLQLAETVDPEILYRDYAYCSGTGRTARDYFDSFARLALSYFPTARTVLDIASNDGSQLDAFKKAGLRTFGVDPAVNLAAVSKSKGHTIHVQRFETYVPVLNYSVFDIITAQNVIAHTSNPLLFLQKCEAIMRDQSRLFIATSQANMIVSGECDTIYHEHVSYFNAHSMFKLAERAGLVVLDILMQDIHGTSFVFVLGKTGEPHARVYDRLEWEFVVGMMAPPLFRWWAAHCQDKIKQVATTIQEYKSKGYFTLGCGAAAKGISMLNMADVKLDLLADCTPTKFGKNASGMHIIPFDSIAELRHEKILFVVLAWNVAAEVRRNVLALRDDPKDIFLEIR